MGYIEFYETKPLVERYLSRQGVQEPEVVAHDILTSAWERGAEHHFDESKGNIVSFILSHASYQLKALRKTNAIRAKRERLMREVPEVVAPADIDLTQYLDSVRGIAARLSDDDAETMRVAAAGYLMDGEWRVETVMNHFGVSRSTAYERMGRLKNALRAEGVVSW